MSADLLDLAVRTALDDPRTAELMALCYKTLDTFGDARRFAASAEFAATLDLLREVGRGPGPVQPPYRLLDVGAGNGIASYAFARAGYRVDALEPSSSEIAGAPAAARLNGFEGVHFELYARPLEEFRVSGPFDVVYLREVLHHSRDLPATVARLARLLAPAGVLICLRDIVVWSDAQKNEFLAVHPLQPITHDEGAFTLREYRAAFRANGLHMLRELHPYASIVNTYPQTLGQVQGQVRHALARRLPRPVLSFLDTPGGDKWSRAGYAFMHRRRTAQLYSFVLTRAAR